VSHFLKIVTKDFRPRRRRLDRAEQDAHFVDRVRTVMTGPTFCTRASGRVYIKLSIVDWLWFCALGIM